jgi:hypothetical protein
MDKNDYKYEWRKIEDIKINDLITWWGFDVPLLAKWKNDSKWIITVFDPVEKAERNFDYPMESELMIKVEEIV